MKKRILAIITAVLMLFVISPQAFAEEVPESAPEVIEETPAAAPEPIEIIPEEISPEAESQEPLEVAPEAIEGVPEAPPEEGAPGTPQKEGEVQSAAAPESEQQPEQIPEVQSEEPVSGGAPEVPQEEPVINEIPSEIPESYETFKELGEPPKLEDANTGISPQSYFDFFQGEDGRDYGKLGVTPHTRSEIKNYIFSYGIADHMNTRVIYDAEPCVVPGNYAPGALSTATKDSALAAFNGFRYIAGLDPVTWDESLAYQEQAAALVNYANDVLDHNPDPPPYMSTDIYLLGYRGCSTSNLLYHKEGRRCSVELSPQLPLKDMKAFDCMMGWMEDSDEYNIDALGHRRWCLNPQLGSFAYGIIKTDVSNIADGIETAQSKVYSSMSVNDKSNSNASQYNVPWPAQQTPLEFFDAKSAWSLSVGKELDINAVNVTLTRLNDGKTWNFSAANKDGYFNVNNENCGQVGCVIFRPDDIEYSNGNNFHVKITGMPDNNVLEYDVQFFSLFAPDPDIPTYPTNPDPDIPAYPTNPATPDDPADADPDTSDKPEVIKGDLLGRGKPSLGSFSLLGQYLLKMRELSPEQLAAADMNGDGSVSMADFALLGRLLLSQ